MTGFEPVRVRVTAGCSTKVLSYIPRRRGMGSVKKKGCVGGVAEVSLPFEYRAASFAAVEAPITGQRHRGCRLVW